MRVTTRRSSAKPCSDLENYMAVGADAVVLENSHDLPYIKPPLEPKGVALMLRIAREIRQRFAGPIGLQMLEAANENGADDRPSGEARFFAWRVLSFAHIGGAGLHRRLRRTSCCGSGANWAASTSKFLAM